MAKQRYIHTKFWSDNFVVNLNPLERYLFLYFLTNEHTNICGIYELPLRTMAFESGLDAEMLEKMMVRFHGKIFYFDGWVYIKNFAKHQAENENVKKGIANAMKDIPKQILEHIKTLSKSMDSLSISSELSESKSLSESKLNTTPRSSDVNSLKPIPDSYLSKFSISKPISSIQALATEIYEATGKREKFPALCGIIKRKGVNFARENWQEVNKSPVRDKLALFKYRMGKTKVELPTK